MSAELQLGYDPYKVWLNIQETQRPLNAYHLLGLRPLETDQARIRTAISRQRSLMESKQAEALPEAWEAVNRELEDAISKLQDPDQKILIDAIIKRSQNVRAGGRTNNQGGTAQPPAAAHGLAEVICRDCETSNPTNRRFCANCGTPLFDSCPSCNTEVTTAEKFCGNCGTNLHETLRKQEAEYEEKIKLARQLQHDHKFDKATSVLRNIAVTEDARFERYARKAVQLLERFAQEKQQYENRSSGRLEKAQKYMERYAYEKALNVLLEISEPLRSNDVNNLIAEARAKRNELLQLGGEIREAMEQNRKHDLLPKIERMLGLKPDHGQARELAESLRDNICTSAKKKLLTHSYDEARIMLETIPTFVRNDEVEKLFDRAIELDSLAVDIRLTPVVDDTIITLAERLGKLSTTDETITKQVNDLKKKKSSKPTDPWAIFPTWGTAPRRTLLGMPVDFLGSLLQSQYESAALEDVVKAMPGQFHVALGLALQAASQSKATIDLMPVEKSNNLMSNINSLTAMLRKASGTAWGIDLSPTGIKAIRIASDLKDGRVKILAVEHMPHGKSLAQADDEAERNEILVESLKKLKAKYNLPGEKDKGKDKIYIGMASRWTLGRFFDLPPIGNKKLNDAVTYEAKHQIPIPLEELNWGYHVMRQVDPKLDPKADPKLTAPHIGLIAVKDFHIKERLQYFKNADISVTGITAEPLALYNAVMHEHLREDIAENEQIAFMDLGSEGSSFLIASKKGFWFRSTGNAGNDITSTLVKKFQLTFSQAEELKQTPSKARRYHLYWEALQPVLVQVGSEIERSLGSFRKQFPDREVKKLYLLGGAGLLHGLLRYLIHGR
jgi:type IV pilus assembly protein PilM